MAHEVNFNKEQNYISVIVEGEFSLSTVKELAADVASFIKRYNCSLVLNDLRHARLTQGTLDIYYMPKITRQVGVEPHIKRALVVSELSPDFHFLETVFINQGHIVKVFTDINAALQWLLNKEKTIKDEPAS